ncbi:MAG: alpha/beta hydrolase [Verrucomicrobiales bacterium]|nr:alpha/beta hydrolase [Verrucomicrobiales bacterium]
MTQRDDLSWWHQVKLAHEFEAGGGINSFAGYLENEERLFEELELKVSAQPEETRGGTIARFDPVSVAYPGSYETDWNRTFEWLPESGEPRGGVLLLHGMSDSPYSIRHVAGALQGQGMQVIGLRLPGHGTVPSGLKYFKWEDMHEAVCLAMIHLREQVKEAPLYVVGYSNGGALAVHYAIETLKDEALPRVNGLVLMSPAVGVTSMASLAIWQRRLGYVLGLEKLGWNAIGTEYDPFKYVSFAVNAGVQVRELTVEITRDLRGAEAAGSLDAFPPVLAFQSIVDATVSTASLIDVLFRVLPENGHELVLFDLNRSDQLHSFVKSDPGDAIRDLVKSTSKTYAISFVTNRELNDGAVVVEYYGPDRANPTIVDLGLSWPAGIYSLSHLAVPFPRTDGLYGSDIKYSENGYQIGSVALRGERGVLTISAGDQLRLRYNPFYGLLETRVAQFVTSEGKGSGEKIHNPGSD